MNTNRIASTVGLLAATTLIAGVAASATPASACATTRGTNVTVVNTTGSSVQVKPSGSQEQPKNLNVNESVKFRVDKYDTMKLTVTKPGQYVESIRFELTVHGSDSVWKADISQSLDKRKGETVKGTIATSKNFTSLTSAPIGVQSGVTLNPTTPSFERDIAWQLNSVPYSAVR